MCAADDPKAFVLDLLSSWGGGLIRKTSTGAEAFGRYRKRDLFPPTLHLSATLGLCLARPRGHLARRYPAPFAAHMTHLPVRVRPLTMPLKQPQGVALG